MSSQVSPITLDDTAARIEESVQCRTRHAIQNLDVRIIDASVILTGKTRTFYAKQLATQAAQEIARDVPFSNNIEVI